MDKFFIWKLFIIAIVIILIAVGVQKLVDNKKHNNLLFKILFLYANIYIKKIPNKGKTTDLKNKMFIIIFLKIKILFYLFNWFDLFSFSIISFSSKRSDNVKFIPKISITKLEDDFPRESQGSWN